jgi:hypothetical protein
MTGPTDDSWEACVAALIELANDDPDFDRVEAAGKQLLGAARKGKQTTAMPAGGDSDA